MKNINILGIKVALFGIAISLAGQALSLWIPLLDGSTKIILTNMIGIALLLFTIIIFYYGIKIE